MNRLIENWDNILLSIKKEHDLSDISFDTWLKPLRVHSIEGNTIYVLVPSEQMVLNYIEKKFTLPLRVTVSEFLGMEYDIAFVLPETAPSKATAPTFSQEMVAGDASNLNPKYTFDTLVVGKNNQFAHSASLAVAESPGEIYNPLYIYGGPGLGKTHLMQSIGHFILQHQPEKKILYVTSEEFTNEVIDSIRNGNSSAMAKLREKYRKVDVLMVDDIQFIIGKESTQEEFFHTFNVLHSAGKQVIISSDKSPKEMETLEDRIRSRFEWGLLADVGFPDYETRMAILRRKEEKEGFYISDDILDYISSNIKSNIRELEGALNKLHALSNLEHIEITMDVAVRELQNIISPDRQREITPQLIIEIVADHFNISLDHMISQSRSNEVSYPRQIAMYLCRTMTNTSLKTICDLLNRKDHTTIIHGFDKIKEEYETNDSVRLTIDTIKKKINPN